MKTYRPNLDPRVLPHNKAAGYGMPFSQTSSISRPVQVPGRINPKNLLAVALVVLVTNIFTHTLFNPVISNVEFASADIHSINAKNNVMSVANTAANSSPNASLFLLDKASEYVPNPMAFETKVREIGHKLGVPPEWLMSVMYSESKFDAAVKNFKGSGATGLIQFMPATAGELGISLSGLASMSHVDQMDYVYKYLNNVKRRYGSFKSLTDLYLGILYPRAIGQDFCYTLYAKPSKSYRQNSGLDENKDGVVSVSDIDKRMQRLFTEAYMVSL